MKRVREVFDNSMLCHVWANETQDQGRSSSLSRDSGKPTMFFKGNEIYSYGYHYLAAKIYTNKDGSKYALINSYQYSNSTRKHLNHIYNALKGKMPVYSVPDCSDPSSERNENHFNNDIAEMIASLFETRKKYYSSVESIKSVIDSHNEILSILGIKKIKLSDKQLNDLESLESERIALNSCPIKNAKRDRVREKRRADLESKFKDKLDYRRNININELITEFREFKRDNITLDIPYNHHAYISWSDRQLLERNGIKLDSIESLEYDILRVNKINVETSRGAEVPLHHAIRLLKLILKGDNVTNERVGLFTLDSILDDPKGDKTIKIGCHKILLSEAVNVLKPYMLEIVK